MYILKYRSPLDNLLYQHSFRKLSDLKKALKENYPEDYLQISATIHKDDKYIEYKQAGKKHFSKVLENL